MNDQKKVIIFGEVLFDCFPSGEQILGGAPFNVAWHLQALGNRPCFISRVGDDGLGAKIHRAMFDWDMDMAGLQNDSLHPTGQVAVELIDNEPHYTITPDCAYDFIDARGVDGLSGSEMLYHGTLALRNPVSRESFRRLAQNSMQSIFLDVNLRSPWWQKEDVYQWLEQARWAKLNEDELQQLGFSTSSNDFRQNMQQLRARFELEQLIVTRGAEGAVVLTADDQFHALKPGPVKQFVDTVGAGDAFTAVYIHGLIAAWPVPRILQIAQQFASDVIGLRGATSTDPSFYQGYLD